MEHTGHSDTHTGTAAGRDPLTIRHLVTFRLGSDTFALPVESVGQVLPMLTITPLPEGAGALLDSVLGAIDLRGQVVPVVDLRHHVGLLPIHLDRDTPLLVTQADDLMVGLIVDEVLDVIAVPAADITPPDDVLPERLGHAPLLAGLVRLPGVPGRHLALLLDTAHLFVPDQRQALLRALDLIHEQAPAAQVDVE